MKHLPSITALLALAACHPPRQPAEQPQPAAITAKPHQSLPEPRAVSPTSDQAAATLVETYFALLEQKDFAAAKRLWGSGAKDDGAFKAEFGDLAEIHAEVGKPGPSEGACGSIYTAVPVKVRSRVVDGVTRLQTGNVTLRRVNNVDGATPDQLRWHISAVELAPN